MKMSALPTFRSNYTTALEVFQSARIINILDDYFGEPIMRRITEWNLIDELSSGRNDER